MIRLGEKLFRCSDDYPSKHLRTVADMTDPQTGVKVIFEPPVSVWRAQRLLGDAVKLASGSTT